MCVLPRQDTSSSLSRLSFFQEVFLFMALHWYKWSNANHKTGQCSDHSHSFTISGPQCKHSRGKEWTELRRHKSVLNKARLAQNILWACVHQGLTMLMVRQGKKGRKKEVSSNIYSGNLWRDMTINKTHLAWIDSVLHFGVTCPAVDLKDTRASLEAETLKTSEMNSEVIKHIVPT